MPPPIMNAAGMTVRGVFHFYGTYRPWSEHKRYGGDSSNYPEFSGRMLDLKKGHAVAVEFFRKVVEPSLGDNFAIAIVPSHDPTSTESGLKTLVQQLAGVRGRVDASSCLVRTAKIDKLAKGGDRSIDVHMSSIVVRNANLIKGAAVLLLDDVKTSGHSLMACRRLLLDAGAGAVQCAALGETGM